MDVFDQAQCRYYDGKFTLCENKNESFLMIDMIGCLIVEIQDHRGQGTETAATTKRIVMKPTAESIWTDIALLSEEWGFPWTESIALQVEAQILVSSVLFFFFFLICSIRKLL